MDMTMNLNSFFDSVNNFFRRSTPLYFFNTLSLERERFLPMPMAREVRMYNCGPTVYGRQHIGNLSMFVFTDTLRKTLEYNGYPVKQVINFTDFGHLSSDSDEGDDKMTLGLKREGLALTLENMKALGEKYAELFLEDIRLLNIDVDHIQFPRASEHIAGEIAMIQTLEEKGYTYTTPAGVYFDTSRFPDYGKLGHINLEGQRSGTRISSGDKRNPIDFILWKSDGKLGWNSPWGMGFPGWHIECSAMIRACLGQQIDIHTGGIEHIPVHHNNEIAQSESATGKKPFSRFWLHRAHLQLEGAKIAKSDGNVVYLPELMERGFHPLAFRYLLLGAHYRSPSNFTWEGMEAAQSAFSKLVALRLSLKDATQGAVVALWKQRFLQRINDDLDTPGALAVLWDMTKDRSLSPSQLLSTLLDFDRVLGLNLAEPDEAAVRLATPTKKLSRNEMTGDIATLVDEREKARSDKNWILADSLRQKISDLGYNLEDTPHGPVLVEILNANVAN